MWISIKTKKPRMGKIVDIWSERHGRLADYRLASNGKNDKYFEPVKGGVSCVRDATHWSYIPEPPTEER